jgi:hypothetical protein
MPAHSLFPSLFEMRTALLCVVRELRRQFPVDFGQERCGRREARCSSILYDSAVTSYIINRQGTTENHNKLASRLDACVLARGEE